MLCTIATSRLKAFLLCPLSSEKIFCFLLIMRCYMSLRMLVFCPTFIFCIVCVCVCIQVKLQFISHIYIWNIHSNKLVFFSLLLYLFNQESIHSNPITQEYFVLSILFKFKLDPVRCVLIMSALRGPTITNSMLVWLI